jgi:DNA-binding NtrC family response regulator
MGYPIQIIVSGNIPPPTESRKRVLIVDDDPKTVKTFRLALEDSGLYEVDTFVDPLVALMNFKPSYYNVLLIGVKMSQMDSVELYNQIKKVDDKAKVCFMCTYTLEEKAMMERFPSLETECFIPKPIEIGTLLKILETQLLK